MAAFGTSDLSTRRGSLMSAWCGNHPDLGKTMPDAPCPGRDSLFQVILLDMHRSYTQESMLVVSVYLQHLSTMPDDTRWRAYGIHLDFFHLSTIVAAPPRLLPRRRWCRHRGHGRIPPRFLGARMQTLGGQVMEGMDVGKLK